MDEIISPNKIKSKNCRNLKYKTYEIFHKEHLGKLLQIGNEFIKMDNFPSENNSFYERDDEKGWWMATKQMLIRSYINLYLNVWNGQENPPKLYFIDALSSYGMNKNTKNLKKDVFIFPGTALNALECCQRDGLIIRFNKIYANDFDLTKRTILSKRFSILNSNIKYPIKTQIPDQVCNNVDSNLWLIEVMSDISKDTTSSKCNYLLVIDNQGMDIKFETIKKIREFDRIGEYGDIIITYQDQAFARKSATNAAEEFYGSKIVGEKTREELRELYMSNLRKIGFMRIEYIEIKSAKFYYTLLFCCRKADSKWLEMIKKYKDSRYNNWTDNSVKSFWNILMGKQQQLTNFL